MARILIYSSPTDGPVQPLVPGLQALAARGHDLQVLAAGQAVGALRDAGLQAAAQDPRIAATRVATPAASRRSVDRLRRSLAELVTRGSLERIDLLAAMEEHRPDVLIVDAGAYGAATVAEASGLAWALSLAVELPAAAPGSGRPPHGLGLVARRGVAGRLRPQLRWDLLAPGHASAMLPGLNALRAESSLPGLEHALAFYGRAGRLLALASAEARPVAAAAAGAPEALRLIGDEVADAGALACSIEHLAGPAAAPRRAWSTLLPDAPRIATAAARAAVRAAAAHECEPARAPREAREVVAA